MKNNADFNRYIALLTVAHLVDALLFITKVAAIGYVIHLIIH